MEYPVPVLEETAKGFGFTESFFGGVIVLLVIIIIVLFITRLDLFWIKKGGPNEHPK